MPKEDAVSSRRKSMMTRNYFYKDKRTIPDSSCLPENHLMSQLPLRDHLSLMRGKNSIEHLRTIKEAKMVLKVPIHGKVKFKTFDTKARQCEMSLEEMEQTLYPDLFLME